jgi:hypothetical protein
VYTMVYCCFVCACRVVSWREMNVNRVVVGESASALGDRRVYVEVVWVVRMFAFSGLSQYSDRGSSDSNRQFSCAWTVNVIGLLFLRQCFIRLPPSMENSISGTLPRSPIWPPRFPGLGLSTAT